MTLLCRPGAEPISSSQPAPQKRRSREAGPPYSPRPKLAATHAGAVLRVDRGIEGIAVFVLTHVRDQGLAQRLALGVPISEPIIRLIEVEVIPNASRIRIIVAARHCG